MKLSVCMIVRNEEKRLRRAIDSLQLPIHELIVVDTGSTDLTRFVAQKAGARVIDYIWSDDFSAARNRSIKEATGDWILVLDADEALDAQGCLKISRWLKNPSSDRASLIQTTYSFNPQLLMWKPNRLTG